MGGRSGRLEEAPVDAALQPGQPVRRLTELRELPPVSATGPCGPPLPPAAALAGSMPLGWSGPAAATGASGRRDPGKPRSRQGRARTPWSLQEGVARWGLSQVLARLCGQGVVRTEQRRNEPLRANKWARLELWWRVDRSCGTCGSREAGWGRGSWVNSRDEMGR